jgi:hypothetical protein
MPTTPPYDETAQLRDKIDELEDALLQQHLAAKRVHNFLHETRQRSSHELVMAWLLGAGFGAFAVQLYHLLNN